MVALNDSTESGVRAGDGLAAAAAAPAQGLPLPALLGLVTRVVTEAVHRGLAADGFADVRPAHGYAFSLIAARGDATGVEIAAHLGMTKQSAKVLIDQLEGAGYVTRERTERDRRARVVRLTERAWAAIEAGTRLWAAIEADLGAVVGGEAVRTTRQALEQLVAMHAGTDDAVPLRPPR